VDHPDRGRVRARRPPRPVRGAGRRRDRPHVGDRHPVRQRRPETAAVHRRDRRPRRRAGRRRALPLRLPAPRPRRAGRTVRPPAPAADRPSRRLGRLLFEWDDSVTPAALVAGTILSVLALACAAALFVAARGDRSVSVEAAPAAWVTLVGAVSLAARLWLWR